MNDIVCRQIAADYCCLEEEVRDLRNHFTVHRFLAERRRYREGSECYLKIAVINGKLLFTGREDIIIWCRDAYAESAGEWFFEAKSLCGLNKRLNQDGYEIDMVHPFYIAEEVTETDTGEYEIRWYEEEEIRQFQGDARFDEAFAFDPDAPDLLGVAACLDGKIVGMAGASCDSPLMRQIGINIIPDERGKGVGKMLTTLMKNEILQRGHLPYYGTSMSHIASQRTALGAGFIPAWAELATAKISSDQKYLCERPLSSGGRG